MAIPESQLEIWASIGSIQQSAQTYESIRSVLNDSRTPYHKQSFTIFLQGSYGNNTNVYRESDVDIVICLESTIYADTDMLALAPKACYEENRTPASYGVNDFKMEVVSWLKSNYGNDVELGRKAITIKGNGSRRNADVLVCAEHHRYRNDSTGLDDKYEKGICFYLSDWTKIVNFPKQHAINCTAKHQATNSQFKPLVRIYKNIRNRMVDDGTIQAGVAPSYFIEGMLWNVPPALFNGTYDQAFCNSFNWIIQADANKLTCASDLHWLVRNAPHVCWPEGLFNAYLTAMSNYWTNWVD